MNIQSNQLKYMVCPIFRLLQWSLILLSLATACSDKHEDPSPEEEIPTETGSKVPYYTLQRVENLAVETDDENPTEPKTAVLFSLTYKKEQPLNYAKTTFWDLSLTGLYNSFIGGNNAANSTNIGYQGPGRGGVAIVEEAFDDVVHIPADTVFKTGAGVFGTDINGAFGEGIGWYLYDFNGDLVSDGSENKKHVAYALGESISINAGGTNKEIPARTILARTSTGDYAKIKMISCYKDAFTRDQMFRDTPHMFFTFEYVIVPAGSTKFEIR
ncbi:hypothetical protein [Olivibacter sp. XZL3]|uniref:hypothetical protein n=1 Tax=Olivibacter sp. XZL3 TaxID=1735116 RepID=UPI001064D89C|nr:hypothetical protein [Olivibacter sp. XZL3]